jgi:hypothetical protein
MYVCGDGCMYICGDVCMCVGMCICVGVYVCVWGCTYVCGDVSIYEAANKSHLNPKFFSSENDWEQNSEVFSLPKMIRNGIPRFFSSAKQAEFRRNCRLFRLVTYSAENFFDGKWQP